MNPEIYPAATVRSLRLRSADVMCDTGLTLAREDGRAVLLLQGVPSASSWPRQEWFDSLVPHSDQLLEGDSAPADVLTALHERLIEMSEGRLCSALLWHWDVENGVASVAEVGSCKLVRWSQQGWFPEFPDSRPALNGVPRAPLGCFAPKIHSRELPFRDGARLALLTDAAYFTLQRVGAIVDPSAETPDVSPTAASDDLLATLEAHGKGITATAIVLSAPTASPSMSLA